MMKKLLLGLLVCVHLALPKQAALGQSGLFPPWTVLGNPSASAALSQSATITQMLDGAFCSTTNAILQRSSTLWVCAALVGANQIIVGGSSGNPLTVSGCTVDSNNSISCSSATSSEPLPTIINTTNDALSSALIFQKNRGGGNTLTSDNIAILSFQGFANTAQQTAARVIVSQTASSSGSNIPSQFRFQTSNSAGATNQTLTFDNLSHLGNAATLVPTASACAGFALATGATDLAGKLTYTSATTCTINFGATYTNAPACVVSPGSAASTHFATTSTTQLAVTFGTAQTAFSWVCIGN